MKFLQKMLGITTYSQIDDSFDEIVATYEHSRNEIRKSCFDEMEKLNPTKDGEKIQRLLIQMNRVLTFTYEKEKTLRDFITLVKR